jgi:hypothetical protein
VTLDDHAREIFVESPLCHPSTLPDGGSPRCPKCCCAGGISLGAPPSRILATRPRLSRKPRHRTWRDASSVRGGRS